MGDLSAVRKRAWQTRRAKYGANGHSGAYLRSGESETVARMRALIIKMHVEEALSEGQVAKATGLHRIEIRRLADEEAERRAVLAERRAMAAEYGPYTDRRPTTRQALKGSTHG